MLVVSRFSGNNDLVCAYDVGANNENLIGVYETLTANPVKPVDVARSIVNGGGPDEVAAKRNALTTSAVGIMSVFSTFKFFLEGFNKDFVTANPKKVAAAGIITAGIVHKTLYEVTMQNFKNTERQFIADTFRIGNSAAPYPGDQFNMVASNIKAIKGNRSYECPKIKENTTMDQMEKTDVISLKIKRVQ